MITALTALRRWLTVRNGDTEPAPSPYVSGGVAVPLPPSVAGAAGGGEGSGHECAIFGCAGPGTCTFEGDDGELDHVCPEHCVYCNPGGDIDRAATSERLRVSGGSVG